MKKSNMIHALLKNTKNPSSESFYHYLQVPKKEISKHYNNMVRQTNN